MFLGLVSVVGFYGFGYVFVMVSVTCFMVSVAGFLVDSAAAGGSNTLERLKRFLVCCVFRTCFRRWLFNGFRRGKERFCMVSVVGICYGFRLLQDRGFISDGNRKTNKNKDISVTN